MQGVRGERVARSDARDMGQRPPAHEVDGDREHDRADGEDVGVDLAAAAANARRRHDGDADRQRGEKAGLGQRRHRLDLGVAERMIGVGGLVGLAHGEEGERARADVERVVRALRKKRERAGNEPGRELDHRQDQAGRDRSRRRSAFHDRMRRGRILADLPPIARRPMTGLFPSNGAVMLSAGNRSNEASRWNTCIR